MWMTLTAAIRVCVCTVCTVYTREVHLRAAGGLVSDLRVVHKFDVPRETVLKEWVPPTLVDVQTSTVVSVPVNKVDNRAWMKAK